MCSRSFSLRVMTYPRSHLLAPGGAGAYHVQSRCVRRAWLCGYDAVSGRDFNHRRRWIEQRILALSDIFAVAIYGYAVMSNHYHLVLRVEPERVEAWQDEDIVDRWLKLCPGPACIARNTKLSQLHRSQLLQDAKRIKQLRHRLSSLSWFMRFINEPLARMANKEDGCTGRFWEGRFRSQLLLDEAAVLAAMVYVDLNPVRAGMADKVEDSEHTSLRRRLLNGSPESRVIAINADAGPPALAVLTLREYLSLVHWTARYQSHYRRAPAESLPELVGVPAISVGKFQPQLLPRPGEWCRAIGEPAHLKTHAKSIGQKWICRSVGGSNT